MFSLSVDDPLVKNPQEERHASPLRIEPRPLDGVYHATYVISRMYYGLNRILDSGQLDGQSEDDARQRLVLHAVHFREGLATVESEGQLTKRGSDIMAGARQYMASVGAL